MFAEKLGKLMQNMLFGKTKYITVPVAPGAATQQALPPDNLPKHVAIIMDGNGRWAVQRGLPRSAGHAAGTEAVRGIIRASDDWGIKHLTLYAFSTENWSRSTEEVGALMGLLLKYFASEIDELDEKNVRIRILGNVEGLPEAQRGAVKKAMERTKDNTGLNLKSGEMELDAIDETAFESELYTAGQPDVDLLIRTSGEMRLSNFLPWQTAYTEMVFEKVYWPDYDRAAYLNSLRTYSMRKRRFGNA